MKRFVPGATLCVLAGLASAHADAQGQPSEPVAAVEETVHRSADEWVERLRAAVTQYRLSTGLREGRSASTAYPDHPGILYWYGSALARTLQQNDAVHVLERALALAPTDRAIAVALLDAYWNFGDLDKARILAPAARQDFPEDPDIAFIAGLLDMEARLRERQKLGLPADGPEHTADRFADAIERGQLEHAIDRYVSRPHLYQWAAGFMGPLDPDDEATRARVHRFVAGLARGAARSTFQEKVLLGFEIQPGATIRPDNTTVVTGYLLARGRLAEKQVALLHAALEQPELSQAVDTELLRTFLGLEPADRDAFSKRLLRVHTLTYWTILLKMLRTEQSEWRVHDLGLDGSFWLSEMNALAQPARDVKPDSGPKAGDEQGHEGIRGQSMGRITIGGLALVAALIGVIITVRHRKRRRL